MWVFGTRHRSCIRLPSLRYGKTYDVLFEHALFRHIYYGNTMLCRTCYSHVCLDLYTVIPCFQICTIVIPISLGHSTTIFWICTMVIPCFWTLTMVIQCFRHVLIPCFLWHGITVFLECMYYSNTLFLDMYCGNTLFSNMY